jgi:cbb3-type cytochrome oxidase subunit 3
MAREVVRALETGPLAEIGLIAFFVAFILILVYVIRLPKKKRDDAKNLPLDD